MYWKKLAWHTDASAGLARREAPREIGTSWTSRRDEPGIFTPHTLMGNEPVLTILGDPELLVGESGDGGMRELPDRPHPLAARSPRYAQAPSSGEDDNATRNPCTIQRPETFITSPIITNAAPASCAAPSCSPRSSDAEARPMIGTSSENGATWLAG